MACVIAFGTPDELLAITAIAAPSAASRAPASTSLRRGTRVVLRGTVILNAAFCGSAP